MRVKCFKKLISVVLSVVMLILCIPSVFATTTDNTYDEYEPGAVIVSLGFDAPSVESLLSDFDIESSRLITPGSGTQNVYLVRFKEKTKEIVLKAIEVLNASPYVEYAEPDYYQSFDDVVEYIIPGNSTQPTDPTQQTTGVIVPDVESTQANEDSNEYEPGAVIVSMRSGSPEWLLSDFDIESSRLITPGSDTQNVYLVRFTEKTKEIVWKAIEVLNASPYVKYAEPDYYQYVDDVVEYIIPGNSTQPTTSSNTENSIIKGDADGDGRLTIADVTCIQKYLVGLISEQEIDCTAANVSGTGTVSIRDAAAIQRKLAGLISDL